MHVAILGGALISIQSRAELRLPETEPVAVGMISPGEVTKVRQGVRTAKLLEAEPKESPKGDQARKQAKRPKTAAAAPPPPPSAAQEEKAKPPAPKAADPPSAAPAAEAQRKAAEAQQKLEAEQQRLAAAQRLAEEKKQAEERAKAVAMQRAEAQKLAEEKKRIEEDQKQADARKRAEEEQKRLEKQRKQAELKKKRDEAKKRREAELKRKQAAKKKRDEEAKKRHEAEAAAKAKQFDADKISALLNKTPNKSAPPPSAASDQPTKAKEPTLGAPEGRDTQISASERAMIGQVIKSCVIPHWTVLSGGASAQETVVKIRLRFNQDGTLSAPPAVTNPQETAYFRAIAESALRAVQQCEPYSLPPDLYEHWRDIIMNFSPKDMF
jgi:colicin import membrane protein